MKMNLRHLAVFGLLGCLGLCAVTTGRAQAPGPYVTADLGGQWIQDIKLKEFFGVPLFPDSKVKLDPGLRVGVAGGYEFCDWFALEGQLGFYGNKIDSITAATELHDSWYYNVPFLVNAKLQFPNRSPLTPYAGAGAGFSESILNVDHLAIMDTQGGETFMHGNDATAVFAWQAFAGLRYRLNDRMGLAIEYRFFWADSPSWNAEFISNTPTDRLSFGETRAHSISLAFDFHF